MMDLGDWIQTVSLLAVAAALLVNVLQLRAVSRQTNSLERAVGQATYAADAQAASNIRLAFLKEDSELLEWQLVTRGYPV